MRMITHLLWIWGDKGLWLLLLCEWLQLTTTADSSVHELEAFREVSHEVFGGQVLYLYIHIVEDQRVVREQALSNL